MFSWMAAFSDFYDGVYATEGIVGGLGGRAYLWFNFFVSPFLALIGLAGLAFPDSVSGQDILLATVTVEGLAEGVWTIASGNSYPDDLTEGFALDPTGFEQVVLEDFAAVTVLPEPMALVLLALGGLVVLRRR